MRKNQSASFMAQFFIGDVSNVERVNAQAVGFPAFRRNLLSKAKYRKAMLRLHEFRKPPLSFALNLYDPPK